MAFDKKKYMKQWWKDNKERSKNYRSERYYAESGKAWADANKEKRNEYARNYYQRNKEKVNANSRAYKQKNKSLIAQHSRLYETRKQQAKPKWLSEFDLFVMDELYDKSRMLTEIMGQLFTVDHIIPLCGKNVCGLHVPHNLQILLGSQNSKKSNRQDECNE